MSGRREDQRFRGLFDRFYRAVYSSFMRRGFSREDAQDLTQVTFVRVLEGMKDYRGEAAWTYVIKIANRVRLNELRYRHAKMRGVDPSSLDDLPQLPAAAQRDPMTDQMAQTPEDEVLEREKDALEQERIQLLRGAIEELPPRMKRCLLMRNEGLKYRQIAVAMKTTLDGVKTLLYQARQRLKKQLGAVAAEQLTPQGDDDP